MPGKQDGPSRIIYGPPRPPRIAQNALKFSFTWVKNVLKMSYQIASLFHMYIDMGERIAGKQDRFEDPPQGPQNTPKIYFFYILAHK